MRPPRTAGLALLLALATGCGGSGHGSTRPDAPPSAPASAAAAQAQAQDTFDVRIDNQVALLPACSDRNTLTFFQGDAGKIDLPRGQVTVVKAPYLWNAYQVGFQVNGWYWRCAGAANCPNTLLCQNPDNAGRVGIIVKPGPGKKGCTSAELDPTWTLGECDASVPSARGVVTVTLVDPSTCTVRIAANGLDGIAPSAGCCDCGTCKSPPGSQQDHCRR